MAHSRTQFFSPLRSGAIGEHALPGPRFGRYIDNRACHHLNQFRVGEILLSRKFWDHFLSQWEIYESNSLFMRVPW